MNWRGLTYEQNYYPLLPVGSVVKSTNTKYNGKVIRWIVGTQDTANGRTGLVTEKMITLKCFDARKEPSNPNSTVKATETTAIPSLILTSG